MSATQLVPSVGRWPLAVGRWPLAVALVATPCVMPALEARASGWEIIVPPPYSGTTPAQEEAYTAQWSDYFFGSVSTVNTGPVNGAVVAHPTPYPSAPSTRPFWKATTRGSLYENASGIGGAAQIIADGKMRCKVHWKRNIVNGVPDVTDNPPKFVYLMMNADVKATATDGGGPGVRDPSKEDVSVFVALDDPPASPAPGYQNLAPGYVYTAPFDTASPTNTNGSKITTATLKRGIKMDVAGRDEFWTPWIKIVGYANLPGNRSATTYPGGASYPSRTEWRNGGVSVMGGSDAGGISYGASLLNLTLSPSPDQLALDNGVASTAPLNQYLINEGIPTSITVQSNDTVFTEDLRANSWWSLAGTAPALRPRLANTKTESNGTAIIRPQHPGLATSIAPNPTPTPENGLKFDVRIPNTLPFYGSDDGWRFPVDNSKFGVKTLTHHIRANNIDAPVALFFPSTGFQHPKGGPKGVHVYQDSVGGFHEMPINTPNYFYYYDKAWQNPWGIPLTFWDENRSESVTNSTGEHIRVGYDTHGSNTIVTPGDGKIETDLFAFVSGSTGLQWVGSESTRGIDTYVRVVSHECTHRLIVRMLAAQNPLTKAYLYADNDPDPDSGAMVGDGLPDVLETYVSESSRGNGLSPRKTDTSGWIAGQLSDAGQLPGTQTGYDDLPDTEVFCRMTEHGLFGPMDQDWANDGLNYGRPLPPNRIQRTALHLRPVYSTSTFTYPAAGSVPVLPPLTLGGTP